MFRFCLLLIFSLSLNNVSAQFTPYFHNYSLSEYSAGNQNWGVSVAENGKLYVANDKGLLEFDGLKWSFFQLPNKTIVRSVLAYNNVIYTGSFEEFGYWNKNKKGELKYTSLSNFPAEKESLDEEFWQILHHNGAILFRSFTNLYIYKDGVLNKLRGKSTIISCNIVDNKVYVSTLKDGIYILQNNDLLPLINIDRSSNVKVVSISKFNNKLLITTSLKGSFLYVGNLLEPWQPEINKIIKQHQLNSFLELSSGKMIFGTIKNGLYITNKSGEILFHLNKESGLLNNTILGLGIGKDNKVWVGLDNGVALIDLNYTYTFYNDNTGELGAVYDIIEYKNTLYIGSNTGLFYLNETDNKLKFIENSQGQVWELREINGELFCGHNNGTYLVENKKLKKISDFTGGWVIKKIPESNNVFIQGTYAGLVKYEYIDKKWVVKHISGTTKPIRYLEFEDPYTAWAAHAYKGLFRVKFDKNYEEIQVKDYRYNGVFSDYNVRVHKIKNDICFKTNEGWQKHEALIDSVVPNQILNKTFGTDTNIISEPSSNLLVTKNNKDKISFVSLNEGKTSLELSNELYKKRLVVDGERVSIINDSLFALNLYDGFMLINKSKHIKDQNKLSEPMIELIEVNKNLVEINDIDDYEFPFNENISISISCPNSLNHYFEYAISKSDTLNWYKMDNEKLELSNLSNGDYKIYFRTKNPSNEVSTIKKIQLKILPPWYKNSLFYLVIFMLTSFVMYSLHKRKISKEQKALHKKLRKEQEELLKEKTIETDKKIIQLKNEALKNEVKLKSKQLANTAMALVKKNESMLDIKKHLIDSKSGFGNSYTFRKLVKKIDNSIGHEDEWEIFEYNFNQVHEEFFNQLKLKFPGLTHKDLKLSAYIKMNLSTKEIAPLMNISNRGVETHRYRLKRKLNLENDNSLTDYLKKFK